MTMRRMLGVMAILFAALLSFAGTAAAQSKNTSVGGSDTTPDPGQTITVSGTGCNAGETVNFFFDGQPAGSTTADSNGDFSGSLTVPDGCFGRHAHDHGAVWCGRDGLRDHGESRSRCCDTSDSSHRFEFDDPADERRAGVARGRRVVRAVRPASPVQLRRRLISR